MWLMTHSEIIVRISEERLMAISLSFQCHFDVSGRQSWHNTVYCLQLAAQQHSVWDYILCHKMQLSGARMKWINVLHRVHWVYLERGPSFHICNYQKLVENMVCMWNCQKCLHFLWSKNELKGMLNDSYLRHIKRILLNRNWNANVSF